MSRRIVFSSVASIVCFGCLGPSQALAAQDQVGLAVTVRNDVSQVQPKSSKILAGDDVIRDEVVQTRTDSGAKFVLKDSTNLVLGPNSTLKLDRTVFSDQSSVGDIAVKLTTGAFRFITGESHKESYKITTPLATIGVRGTTLDFLIERLKNTVVLKSCESQVCAGGRCVELLREGDSAVVTSNGARIDIQLQPASWSFDSVCNGMCSPMSFAEAQNTQTTGSIGAGGGGGGGGGTGSPPPSGGPNLGTFPTTSTFTPNHSTPLITGGFGGGGFAPVSPH
jgi:hypothetical protein